MTDKTTIQTIRKDYTLQALNETELLSNPYEQLARWLQEAITTQQPEPNAMHLCTVNGEGKPSGRIVLLRGFDERGVVFYSNYTSRKGQDMALNPHASATFFWANLERQIRIEGSVSRVSEQESDAYFQSRPRSSQIGAWSSPQSQIIESRQTLEEKVDYYKQKFGDHNPIPRPDFWGGYRIVPTTVEFWQGRASRLHDRIVYLKNDQNLWTTQRLAP